MSDPDNRRETGGRNHPPQTGPDRSAEFSQDAAANKPPRGGMGNSERVDDTDEKNRHSDGQDPPKRSTPHPSTEKTSGAGPAVAEHSKDTKAPRSGRQPGAFVKE